MNGPDGVLNGDKQRKVAQHVIREVQRMVLSGEVRPGDRLPSERVWSERLAVTRQNVREALRVLEVLGLVERRPRGGTYVSNREFEQAFLPILSRLRSDERVMADITELRRVLEPAVCALAAQRVNDESLADIRHAHEDLARSQEQGDDSFERAADFHLAIARATKNRAISALMTILTELISTWRGDARQRLRSFDPRPSRNAIVSALERRDPASAWAAMVTHLDEVSLAYGRPKAVLGREND